MLRYAYIMNTRETSTIGYNIIYARTRTTIDIFKQTRLLLYTAVLVTCVVAWRDDDYRLGIRPAVVEKRIGDLDEPLPLFPPKSQYISTMLRIISREKFLQSKWIQLQDKKIISNIYDIAVDTVKSLYFQQSSWYTYFILTRTRLDKPNLQFWPKQKKFEKCHNLV